MINQQLAKCYEEKSELEQQLQSSNQQLAKCHEEKSELEQQLNEQPTAGEVLRGEE